MESNQRDMKAFVTPTKDATDEKKIRGLEPEKSSIWLTKAVQVRFVESRSSMALTRLMTPQ